MDVQYGRNKNAKIYVQIPYSATISEIAPEIGIVYSYTQAQKIGSQNTI